MRADALKKKHGEALIGRVVKTQPFGEWPGGNAKVINLGEDAAAPEIVFNVLGLRGLIRGWTIGVFEYEIVELVR